MFYKFSVPLIVFYIIQSISLFGQNIVGTEYMTSEERDLGHTMLRNYRKSRRIVSPSDSIMLKKELDSLLSLPNYNLRNLVYTTPPPSMGTNESIANGGINGFWRFNQATDNEYKTGNYGHRTDLVQYNSVKNRAYVLSAVRNLLVGDMVDNTKLTIPNQNIKLDGNIFLCLIKPDGNSRLIGGIGSAWDNQCLHYSDDDGVNWAKSSGGEFQDYRAIWGTILNNSEQTVLALVRKYVLENGAWKNKFLLIKSTDKGVSYNSIYSWDDTNSDQMSGCNPYFSNDCYIVRKLGGTSTVETYKFTASNGTFNLLNTSQITNKDLRNVVGTYLNNKLTMYTALGDQGYLFNGSGWDYINTNTGWNNLYGINPNNEKHLYLHDYDTKFSKDGGITIGATDWWEPAYGWDPKDTKWFKKSDGTWFMAHCNDFGAHFSESPEDKTAWKHLNIAGVHQILHHGDSNDKTDLLVTGNQDRGSMVWTEKSPGILEGFTAAKADGLREATANTGNSYWFIHYWGVLYHKFHPSAKDDRIAEFKITDVDWYTPAMAPSFKVGEDAMYVAGFDQFKKYTYNSTSNTITETVFPFNFKTNTGARLYGIATSEADPNRIYVSTENGSFYYSKDGGNTWTKTTYSGSYPNVGSWPYWGAVGYAITVSDQNPDIVYLSSDGNVSNGFLVSKDGGKTFTVATNGMTRFRNQELVVSSNGKYVFGTNLMVYVVAENKWYDMAGGSCPNEGGMNGVDFLPSKNTIRYYSWGVGVLDFVMNGTAETPVVKITSPSQNGALNNGDAVLKVSATDGNGTISKVDLYLNGIKNSSSSTSPFEFNLNTLAVGTYIAQVVAYDNDGNVGRSSEVSFQIINLRNPDLVSCTTNGLNYNYYEGSWSGVPNTTLLTPKRSGQLDNFDISSNSIEDGFMFSYTGYIDAPSDGLYTFKTNSDDGSMLYVGSTLVVDNNGLHDIQSKSGSIGLKKGLHAIKVDFHEAFGGQYLGVSWSGPNFTDEAIPNSRLFRENINCNNSTHWHFTSNMEGWNAFQAMSNTVSNSILTANITGGDPYMHSPNNLGISATDYKYMVIGMQNLSTDNTAQLYWITDTDGAYDGVKATSFSITPNDTKMRYYIIDLSAKTNWKGLIKQIRFDPLGSVSSGTVKIDFIKFVGTKPSTISAIPGTIEIEDFDLGGQGNAYNETDASNNGGQYRTTEEVDIENCAEGGYDVGWTAPGEWMEYLVNVSKTAKYDFMLRTASASDGNQYHLEVDEVDVTGVKTVNTLGGLQSYFDIKNTINLSSGKHVLKLVIDKANGGFNLNKMVFTEAITTNIEDTELSELIAIYPNPANTVLNLNLTNIADVQTVYLLNVTGEIVLTKIMEMERTMIDIQNLSSGVYILKVGEFVHKIIINKQLNK